MRDIILILAILAFISCDVFQFGDFYTVGPGQGQRRDAPGQVGSDSLWADYPFASCDTTLYFTVVRDDSLKKEISLFRNWKPILTLDVSEGSGFSTDPDMSHIIDGHLITQGLIDGKTVICKDGDELLRIPSREYLIGLLEKDDDIFILTRRGVSDGFVLRKNGTVLMERESGTVFGDFSRPSYFPNGALYEDGGQYCFSFSYNDGECRNVIGGREMVVKYREGAGPAQDIRRFNGDVEAAVGVVNYVRWSDSSLWHDDRYFVQTGEMNSESILVGRHSAFTRIGRGTLFLLPFTGATMYFSNEGVLCGVRQDESGKLMLGRNIDSDYSLLDGEFLYFSPQCGKLIGNVLILGLSRKNGCPTVWYKNRFWDLYWVEGRITDLYIDFDADRM